MVRISSAARPTMDERFLAIGWSSRSLRYSVGISPETRERRNTSPLRRYSWDGLRSAKVRGVLEDGVQDLPGIGTRAAERREDLAARRGLLTGVSQREVHFFRSP